MAHAADQFRRSDVTLWGVVAAVAAGAALLSANVSPLVPDQFFAGLHDSRLIDHNAARLQDGLAEIAEARTSLAAVRNTAAALQRANARLTDRLDELVEQAGGVRERVGALESALPRLIKNMPLPSDSKLPLVTGSIEAVRPNPAGTTMPDADGGSARLRHVQLQPAPDADQPMPSLLAPSPMAPEPLMPPPSASNPPSANVVPPSAPAAMATLPPGAAPGDDAGAVPTADLAVAATPTPSSRSASLAPTNPPLADGGPVTTPPVAPDAKSPTLTVRPVVPLAPIRAGTAIASASAAPASASPANVRAIGIAVGPAIQPATALSAWEGLAAKIGVLLVGTSPLLADDPAGSAGKVLVAGPIASIAVATKLCANIDRAGITCTPMPYVGTELNSGGGPATP